jgi:hypothetical protein
MTFLQRVEEPNITLITRADCSGGGDEAEERHRTHEEGLKRTFGSRRLLDIPEPAQAARDSESCTWPVQALFKVK